GSSARRPARVDEAAATKRNPRTASTDASMSDDRGRTPVIMARAPASADVDDQPIRSRELADGVLPPLIEADHPDQVALEVLDPPDVAHEPQPRRADVG